MAFHRSTWIPIQPNALDIKIRTLKDGIETESSFAPADIAQGVRLVTHKEGTLVLHILQFQYPDQDSTSTSRSPFKNITLLEGEHSKKLLEIKILLDRDQNSLEEIPKILGDLTHEAWPQWPVRRDPMNIQLLRLCQTLLLPAISSHT
jgi:hypothetical protein